jgi:hypothetical protein
MTESRGERAKRYNSQKNTRSGTARCVYCDLSIKANAHNCVGFGLYGCEDCRELIEEEVTLRQSLPPVISPGTHSA